MALPPSFLEELRARVPVAAVVARRVKLERSGKQHKGCCPFHGEKTPSFYVYEDGYHCFGCGAHGDVITFVMQSQGLSFIEAVKQLAAEAGLDVPAPSPEAAEAERRRIGLQDVLRLAQDHYQRRLHLPEGKAARDYLLGRGLTPDTIERFGLGWAGERGALTADLKREGVELGQLEDAGLLRRDEDTGRVFELFGNRVMFPIRDRGGALVSFGGRILGAGQPKYVNGPETALFSKRRNLFGLNIARDGVRNGATLIVVEGYMDVIAAVQAGFAGAVAPLGTALTNEQLDQLWRLSPDPTLCFDGDAAGGRAALRALEIALPHLTSQRSLRFAALPPGEDPDSLVRKGGAAAFKAVLDSALPPADALYDMMRRDTGEATPEQRATLRNRLIEAAGRVEDKSLAGEYRRTLLDKFFASRPRPQAARDRKRAWPVQAGPPVPRPVLHQDNTAAERFRILTAILLRHPAILHDVSLAYASLAPDPRLASLQAAIEASPDTEDSAALIEHLTAAGLATEVGFVLSDSPLPLPSCAAAEATRAEAETGWWHIFGFLNVEHLREEVDAAQQEAARNLTAETQRRHTALVEALWKVRMGEPDGAGAAGGV